MFFTIDLSKWNEISSEKFIDESSQISCEIKLILRLTAFQIFPSQEFLLS